MKTQIGVGSKIIDKITLIILSIIVVIVSITYYSYLIILIPVYISFFIYLYYSSKKYYIYFDQNTFLIENVFSDVQVDASLYEKVTLTGFESIFVNYCYIKFKNGRKFKFINDSKNINELELKINELKEFQDKKYT